MMELLIKSYNKSAKNYEKQFKELQFVKYEQLLNSDFILKKSKNIVDFGCGTALLKDYLNQKDIDIDYYGIDLSENMVKIAKTKTQNVILGDVSDTPYKDNAVDIVASFTVLRIIEADETSILNEIYRVLQPKGIFYLSVLSHKVDDLLLENLKNQGFRIVKQIPCGQDTGFICKKEII